MRNRIDLYSRVSVAIVLALVTSQLLVQEVFLGYSPRVRTDLADRLVETSLVMINFDNYRNFFRKDRDVESTLAQNEAEAQDQLEDVSFKPTLIKGVYARETDNAVETRINIPEIDWIEINYQKKDGSTVKVKIPRGTQPPPAGLF